MFERVGEGAVGLLKKAILAVFLVVILAAIISWARTNPVQARATTNKVMNAGASTIGWAADGVTGLTGGSAAEAAGTGGDPEIIMVQNHAPNRWRVGAAIRAWNRGLTTVQLKAGDCVDGLKCIKVTQVSDLPREDGRLVLGRTNTFFGLSVKFNGSAVNHVSASYFPVAACHELGHALGAEHRSVKTSCMDAVIGAGVVAQPDATDYAKVDAKHGH